jgi:hypothetical protein
MTNPGIGIGVESSCGKFSEPGSARRQEPPQGIARFGKPRFRLSGESEIHCKHATDRGLENLGGPTRRGRIAGCHGHVTPMAPRPGRSGNSIREA